MAEITRFDVVRQGVVEKRRDEITADISQARVEYALLIPFLYKDVPNLASVDGESSWGCGFPSPKLVNPEGLCLSSPILIEC